ncbi:MAG: sigma-70 family RNA polymerase sigma factor [Deltaproteobacteria bacterium]|nr:sigma-70 family RNA polymerase sigma factor [Deltaproteobacteria bacterium]MBW2531091.1 sigma-70 family RNA polymerase sigma factor [Deltaproteobacteria bacterium]
MSSARAVALVEAARAGDSQSFARLYQVFGPVVHAVVVARVPVDAAEDIMQDVFETALERIGQLREPAAFVGWLLTIARNRATDWLRRKRPTTELDEAQVAAPAKPTAEAEQVLEVIRSLPDAYSETLVMRFVEGMTGPEIAARTGLSHGSVRVNLTRGMKLLRAKLALRGRHV